MQKLLSALVVTSRPKQWIKNLSLFVAIFFAGEILIPAKFMIVFQGFIVFCLTSSAIYFLNDYQDREKDKLHPGKKNRPLATGALNPNAALWAYGILSLVSLALSLILSEYFFFTVLSYLVLLSTYALYFRNIIIVDGLIIAFGFVLRVWAGALITAAPISSWLIICTIATALLMAFGRRRCELTILKKKAAEHRHTLSLYPEKFLDAIITAATSFTLISYTLFTFFQPISGLPETFTSLLPEHWINSRWLMATIPIVIYSVFRYLYLIYEKDTAASPEEAVFEDKPLLFSIILWLAINFILVYLL